MHLGGSLVLLSFPPPNSTWSTKTKPFWKLPRGEGTSLTEISPSNTGSYAVWEKQFLVLLQPTASHCSKAALPWVRAQRNPAYLFSQETLSISILCDRERDWDCVSRLLDGELLSELTPSLLWLRWATPERKVQDRQFHYSVCATCQLPQGLKTPLLKIVKMPINSSFII